MEPIKKTMSVNNLPYHSFYKRHNHKSFSIYETKHSTSQLFTFLFAANSTYDPATIPTILQNIKITTTIKFDSGKLVQIISPKFKLLFTRIFVIKNKLYKIYNKFHA